ncbi:uncharacterized protein LOC112559109 isoform X1 [Pomacea canaliculata]|uniref:uncharacterized protein LOC112559109 isoform X1 n=1 Tax=Pomacea canaliculata TaxID=400727 RepID=UPI000D7351D3|nr:uncharacterized protein LOC112559109 isoform X1 [Pomacea canaliculata]
MEKKNLAVSIFVFVAILLSAYVVQIECSAIKKQERFRREENDNTDVTFPEVENERMGMPKGGVPTPSPSTSNTTIVSSNTTEPFKGDNGGSVAVPVIIAILVIIVVGAIAAFVFYRIRRRRAADYEKKTKIQMSSTGNAGVYVDPTTTLAEGDKEKPAESPEHERLNKEED